MNAEILAVGTELLMGQIANTNAQYISNRLGNAGINVYHHSVVGDNAGRLKDSLNIAMRRSDIVILTGGLGPTQDDLTKETVAAVLNRKMILQNEILEVMKAFFYRHGKTMTQNNIKQAYLPEGCIIIKNKNGTAPGCIIENEGKIIIMLPGPPREMQPMLDDSVIPYFEGKTSYRLESIYVKIFGIGESEMEDRLSDIIRHQSNPTIAPYAKEGEVTLRITARYRKDLPENDLITPVVEEIKERLGSTVYSTENKTLSQVVGELLINNNITISIAESCTGGMISSNLTDIAGISAVFDGSMVTYSNRSKMENLHVSPEIIGEFGAVSKECAMEMAKGIKNTFKTKMGLSVTGIAGPGGGTENKPVGLVYLGIADENGVDFKELRLWGDRNRIRNVASLYAFDTVRRRILFI